MENKPRISKWIERGYILLFVFIALLFTAVAAVSGVLSTVAAAFFVAVVALVLVILSGITYCFHKTIYTISNGSLYSWSPFAVINLKLKDIAKVERTRVPFYFKGWGASLYSGRFYIAGFGWTRVIITNLTDGILITDKSGKRYLITPSNPDSFIKLLRQANTKS